MKQIPWIAFSIGRSSKTPIFEQICNEVRLRTNSGELKEGTRMPATRSFAVELGVSRSTVVTAYEQLVAEGYLKSYERSGYEVCTSCAVEMPETGQKKCDSSNGESSPSKPPFAAGQPDMRIFPYRAWAKTISRTCRTKPESMLIWESGFGNYELRKAIVSHVAEWRGIEALPDQVMVTAGATDALEICIRTLMDSGDGIGMEDPGFLALHHFAYKHGLKPCLLTIDADGATLPRCKIGPKLVHITPSHQYPLGGAMTPNRRLEFIKWAEANEAWIIEDDYDSEFRYAGRPIPALAGFDHLNRTMYVGSFSKIFSNSLRIGYVIIPLRLIDKFKKKIGRDRAKVSYMPQQPLAEFIETGEFHRHLRRMRRIYSKRRKFLMDRLYQEFSNFGTFFDYQAGMHVVFHLDEKWRDTEVCRYCQSRGVYVQAVSTLSPIKTSLNGLILGFSAHTEMEMEKSLRVLKYAFSQ